MVAGGGSGVDDGSGRGPAQAMTRHIVTRRGRRMGGVVEQRTTRRAWLLFCNMVRRHAAACLLLLASRAGAQAPPPPVPREFRAAWVATVGNIDWPSRPGLS